MTREEAEEAALEEAKLTGKNQVVYLIFDNGDVISPNYSFCEENVFEEKVETTTASLFPLGKTNFELKYEVLETEDF